MPKVALTAEQREKNRYDARARLLDGDRTVRLSMEVLFKLEEIAKLREEEPA